jgi:hypothetical protein
MISIHFCLNIINLWLSARVYYYIIINKRDWFIIQSQENYGTPEVFLFKPRLKNQRAKI